DLDLGWSRDREPCLEARIIGSGEHRVSARTRGLHYPSRIARPAARHALGDYAVGGHVTHRNPCAATVASDQLPVVGANMDRDARGLGAGRPATAPEGTAR